MALESGKNFLTLDHHSQRQLVLVQLSLDLY
uniref:Uncharacterized protein n=1 Tax=Rhizophora mucronata TaxID=61149 RepID=A0A2P2NWB1_RHIMU